jgi:hypothetical protein
MHPPGPDALNPSVSGPRMRDVVEGPQSTDLFAPRTITDRPSSRIRRSTLHAANSERCFLLPNPWDAGTGVAPAKLGRPDPLKGSRRSDGTPPEKRKGGSSILPLATTISAGSGLRFITRHNPWPDLQPFHAANMQPSRGLAARRKEDRSPRRDATRRRAYQRITATTQHTAQRQRRRDQGYGLELQFGENNWATTILPKLSGRACGGAAFFS